MNNDEISIHPAKGRCCPDCTHITVCENCNSKECVNTYEARASERAKFDADKKEIEQKLREFTKRLSDVEFAMKIRTEMMDTSKRKEYEALLKDVQNWKQNNPSPPVLKETAKRNYEQGKKDERARIKAELEKLRIIMIGMEERANFFYNDLTDLTNKKYERGFFDGIHNAKAQLDEALSAISTLDAKKEVEA